MFSYEPQARCLKITENVSFNNASEASFVYILSGQKFIKNVKKWYILAIFWKCAIFSYFQTMWVGVDVEKQKICNYVK